MIEEDRGSYLVSYQPADARSPFALLNLIYSDKPEEAGPVAKAMEMELERWLKRYPVPVKISAFDADNKLIRLSAIPSQNHLVGYVRPWDEAIVRRWALLEEREVPSEQRTPEYLEAAYKGVPFRMREEDRERVRWEFRERLGSLCLIASFTLILPLLVQAVRHGPPSLVVLITMASVAFGGYRLAVFMRWRKPSRWEQAKMEWKGRVRHYCYHCETNPAGFARLEAENFERELAEGARPGARSTGREKSWMPILRSGVARRLPVLSH